MLTILSYIIVYLSFIVLPACLNPIKLRMSLVLFRMFLFIEIFFTVGRAWIRRIFIIIFIGGIMVIFIILSSLLPNEKNLKINKIFAQAIILIFILSRWSISGNNFERRFNQRSKLLFFSNESLEVLIIIILLYFFSFLVIISKEICSLRSIVC